MTKQRAGLQSQTSELLSLSPTRTSFSHALLLLSGRLKARSRYSPVPTPESRTDVYLCGNIHRSWSPLMPGTPPRSPRRLYIHFVCSIQLTSNFWELNRAVFNLPPRSIVLDSRCEMNGSHTSPWRPIDPDPPTLVGKISETLGRRWRSRSSNDHRDTILIDVLNLVSLD